MITTERNWKLYGMIIGAICGGVEFGVLGFMIGSKGGGCEGSIHLGMLLGMGLGCAGFGYLGIGTATLWLRQAGYHSNPFGDRIENYFKLKPIYRLVNRLMHS